MTCFIQVLPGRPEANTHLRPSDYMPWLNCKSLGEALQMAVHRHLRNRGGLQPGEHYEFTAAGYDEKAPRHENGAPITVTVQHLIAHKD